MILYINACVRPDSRTRRIAEALLEKLGGAYTERRLETEGLRPLDAQTLAQRTERIARGDYSHPMFRYAKEFAEADTVVIAAPFWDLSFPSLLKVWLEHIYVTGIVSRYSDEGIPVGLCRARRLYYVTTAGGPYIPDFSYDCIAALAVRCFGIPQTELICAEGLDIVGNDADAIVAETIASLRTAL